MTAARVKDKRGLRLRAAVLMVGTATVVLVGGSATSKAEGVLYGLGMSFTASTLYTIDTTTAGHRGGYAQRPPHRCGVD